MNRRNFLTFGLLLYLGAVYESLYVFGILPFSILEPAAFFTPQTMPWLSLLTAVAATRLFLKGWGGFGDMRLTSQAIITPGRTVRRILRGLPGLLPLDRVVAIRVLGVHGAGGLEIRYRTNAGEERRSLMPVGAAIDLDGFLSSLRDRGIRVEADR